MTLAEMNVLKALITEATVNEQFLSDPTGNRRFAPFTFAAEGIDDPRTIDFQHAGMFVTATDIPERINVGVKIVLSTKKIGMVMKRLGFEKITKGKYHTIVYRVVEYTLEEISANRRTAEELTNIDYKLPF
ncbi:MAG: virulence-associated E family protein [Prevotellaceae bacterium]|jgi:hypothetical protein|nr:virulence-associated E family protein [Prevotellaceae bacterium]